MSQLKSLIAIASLTAAMLAPPALAAEGYQAEEIEASSPEDAQPKRPSGPMTLIRPAALLLATFDGDQDYVVSAAELESGLENTFAGADKDKSGHLTLMELQNWRSAALGSPDASPTFLTFDPNLDQRISREEFHRTLRRSAERSDKNKDGALNFAELIHIMEARSERTRPEEGQKRSRPSREGREGGGRRGGR